MQHNHARTAVSHKPHSLDRVSRPTHNLDQGRVVQMHCKTVPDNFSIIHQHNAHTDLRYTPCESLPICRCTITCSSTSFYGKS